VRAEVAFAQNRGGDAPLLLLGAAQRLEALDVPLARRTYLEAWGAALFAGALAKGGSIRDVSRAAAAAPRPPDVPGPGDLLLDGLGLLSTEGRAAATPVLRRAIATLRLPDATVEDRLRLGWLASRVANVVWDHDASLDLAGRTVQLARESGTLETLASANNGYGQAAAFAGDLVTVEDAVAEVEAVRGATATRIRPHAALVLAGFRGREPVATELIGSVLAQAPAGGQGVALQYAHWATAVLMNGLGRYEEALEAAVEASAETPELYISAWASCEVVEAGSRSGDAERASAGLERLREQTAAAGTDWALGVLARAEALLSEGEDAEQGFREAVDRLGRTRLRPDLARAHLLYGEWLRREGRRVDARSQLRTAHGLFEAIGMEAFAERARGELLATGERVRRRTADTRDELTPQERQIARLARGGLSNPQIGAQLFLSPRTVEWHLRKVFAKLEIRSRADLARALPSSEVELAPA
jgi:DNA-binding CsgD family transcriptional regulator